MRSIDLKPGENEVKFTDVASGIDPTTVSFESLTAPDSTSVLEQNYEYDVTSSDKLLEKYLGKEVEMMRRLSANQSLETIKGKLLAHDSSNLVVQTGKGVQLVSRSDIAGITLADAGNLITKPTLVWKISADKGGEHNAQVTYQTDGLTWRADYNITVNANDTAADIGALGELLNESGASYPNAKLKLVAGDVQRIQPPQEIYRGNWP